MRRNASISIVGGMLLAVVVAGVVAAGTSPFAGRWTSTDPDDSSSQVLVVSGGDTPTVTFQDFFASACANHAGPASHWVSAGLGEVDGDTLYAHYHKSGCGGFSIGAYDDWYQYDAGTDTLTDSFGITWYRNP